MKTCGDTLNACYHVKEANLKRLCIVWSQLYDILERANYEDSKKISGYPGCGEGKMSRLVLWLLKNSAWCCTDTCYYSSSQTHRVYNTQNINFGASLLVQWIRIHLPMQETWDQSLVKEDPTCCMATKCDCRSFWACALEPGSCNYRSPHALKNTFCNEKPLQWEAHAPQLQRSLYLPQLAKSLCSNKDPAQPKLNN